MQNRDFLTGRKRVIIELNEGTVISVEIETLRPLSTIVHSEVELTICSCGQRFRNNRQLANHVKRYR